MKHRITTFLAFVLMIATATAQGEWKWAHYWSGQDGTGANSYHNYITNTAFDDEGNLYVYGSMGGNNPVMDGEPFEYCPGGMAGGQNNRTILLTKFDTLGNMLWYKVVRSQTEAANPHWMEVKEDRVCISGSSSFWGSGSGAWLYFLDTLITKAQIDALPAEQRKPPFKAYSRWTFFAEFDFDGNLLECHFVEAFSRELVNDIRSRIPLCSGAEIAPTHCSRAGDVFFYTHIEYGGNEEDPYTIVVDGDTNRTYNLFLPRNTDMAIGNAMLYKFTPEWTLDFAHLLVDHTDGIATSYELLHDSINPLFNCYLKGLSFDEEDNMYISGYINLALCTESHGGNLHNYPVHIWWDDSHSLSINNIDEAPMSNFIVRYNVSGQAEWCNQVHLSTYGSLERPVTEFHGNAVCDNLVFVCGNYDSGVNGHPIAYFGPDINDSIVSNSASQQMKGYIVAFDKNDGHYLFNTIIPNDQFSRFPGDYSSFVVVNNRIVAMGLINPLDSKRIGVAEWGNTGEFLSFEPFESLPNSLYGRGEGVSTDGDGNLCAYLCMKGSIAFSESVYVNGSATNSNAVFGVYHDPELLVPYVKVPEYQGSKPEVRLWPNPATDKITIESEADFPIKSIAVTDLQGRLLTVLPGNDVRHTLNIHKLPVGTYIAHIETKADITDVKFVKGE